MRGFLGFISLLFLTAFLAAAGVLFGLHLYSDTGPLSQEKFVIIAPGSGVSTIAATLDSENVISSPLLFKIAVRLSEKQSKLQAGEYKFERGISMDRVIDKIASGDIFVRQVTIPEGKTSYETVQILKAHDGLEKSETKELSIPDEGSLLPGTYRYQSGDTARAIIEKMRSGMETALNTAWEMRASNLPLNNKQEALILASIIEKETGAPEERRRVAGVFINRLEKGMLLQTDPTVIYGLTEGRHAQDGEGPLNRRLLTRDLRKDTPYNTYMNEGLPPGPICNPGKESIEAALNPERHDYFYFVADGTGGHAFSKTLDEHNRNVAKWRKIRSGQ